MACDVELRRCATITLPSKETTWDKMWAGHAERELEAIANEEDEASPNFSANHEQGARFRWCLGAAFGAQHAQGARFDCPPTGQGRQAGTLAKQASKQFGAAFLRQSNTKHRSVTRSLGPSLVSDLCANPILKTARLHHVF